MDSRENIRDMKTMTVKNSIREIKETLNEYVLEYIIYIDSGYDPYKALILLSQRNDGKILSGELRAALNRMQNGASFQKAVMSISDSFYETGLDSFLRIVTRGYIRGGEGTTANLRILIEKILHEEVAEKKEKAERASTKLSFPITLIFIAIIIISVYPAIRQFKF
jgi:tight adherence protein C